jgi:hypothetical protein
MVEVLTLKTRGIKGEQNRPKRRADILLLQETNLSTISELPGLPTYKIIQNTAIQVGSGAAIVIFEEIQTKPI